MTNPNDPCFPERITIYDNPQSGRSPLPPYTKTVSGLTKREYFAAMAMQGFVAGIHAFPDQKVLVHWKGDDMAIYCLKLADALLAELSKPVNPEGLIP